MKKFIFILSIILLVGCMEDPYKKYGYNTKTKIPVQTTPENPVPQKKETFRERTTREFDYHNTRLYDLKGREIGSVNTYKGTYDGHEFYVFSGPDKMSVVPVAMVEYYENLLKQYEAQQVYNSGEGW